MKNNKGFAISELIYPILILFLFLIVMLLVTLQSRKNILNRNKENFINEINGEKVYKDGEVIYFNPETGKKCSENEYSLENSLNQNKSGCMKWYAFSDNKNSDTVNAILDHNTTSQVAWNSSDSNIEMKEAKIELDKLKTVNHWLLEPRMITHDEILSVTGKDSNFKREYAWLFSYTNDCVTYGCYQSDGSTYGYWTSTSNNTNKTDAWSITFKGSMENSITSSNNYGIRPVVSILKSDLK